MNKLEQECLDYLRDRWERMPASAKTLLKLNDPEVAAFTVVFWAMQFYRDHSIKFFAANENRREN